MIIQSFNRIQFPLDWPVPKNMLRQVVVLVLLVCSAYAIPIDNGLSGDPEIECGPTSIQLTFNTENNFEGHVYVKGLYDQEAEGCRTSGDGSRAVGSIELPFDSCNVVRERSLNPKGIFVRTTVIISFHPNFMTKIDRAFTFQCFYMEADKTVDTDIEVSMITTGFQTQFVPMPICRYEIFDAATGGDIVEFAIIGQAVYHTWTCDTETVDTFCMYVYSCFVVDPAGADRLDLIDDQGCALDKYLMGNVEYPTDLMGVREVHVFKYTDRPALFFQCQIQITVKEPNADCIRPVCAEPDGRGDGSGSRSFSARRGKRSVSFEEQSQQMDVSSLLNAIDLEDKAQSPLEQFEHRAPAPRHLYAPVTVTREDGVCLSSISFTALLATGFGLTAALATVLFVMKGRSNK